MTRWIAVFTFTVVFPGFALAQPGGPIGQYQRRPTFSPYLNLGRGGNPALNYYGLVKPQVDTDKSLSALQKSVKLLGTGNDVTDSVLDQPFVEDATGHPTRFFHLSHYFPTMPNSYFTSGAATGGTGGGAFGGSGGAGVGGNNRGAVGAGQRSGTTQFGQRPRSR